MKYIFVLNKYTLSKRIDKVIKKIEEYSNINKLDYLIEINDNNETEDILNKYQDNENIIIAVGGDGMINRVLNSIIDTNNILGFIPLGTGNDLYRCVKEEFKENIYELNAIKINDRYFINVACFGIDADIGNKKNIIDNKFIPKKLRYVSGIITTLFKYKNREFKITINDEEISNKFATIAICNGTYYGGGFKIGYDSNILDNIMDTYIVEDVSRLKMIKLLLKMKRDKLNSAKEIRKIISDKLIIESPIDISCNIDGEILTSNKFIIESNQKKIRVYYNEDMINSIIK